MQSIAFQKANNTIPSNWISLGLPKLDPQASSTLGTTSPDNSRPTAGFHANSKAVGSFSPGHGRLVSALHLFSLRPINKTSHYNP